MFIRAVKHLELFCILFVGGASDEVEVEMKTVGWDWRSSLCEQRLVRETQNTEETLVSSARRPAM